jgi:periplasmic protein TonB
MSKLNINKNEWLELVFEGKNKEYGAYQLRQEDGKTTLKAFLSALALLAGIATLPFILSSFSDKPTIGGLKNPDGVLRVVDVVLLPKDDKPKVQAAPVNTERQKPITSRDLLDPTIVDAVDAPDIEFTEPANVGQTSNPNTSTTGTPTGTSTGTETNTTIPVDTDPNGIKTTFEVEKNPNFPGGIGEFLKIVGNKFEAPSIDEEKTVRVVVFFVVERDGSLSNITVPKSPGYGLDKEAIRVLKSIKTKWEPGIYNGKPVRTSYSLPIVVKMQ